MPSNYQRGEDVHPVEALPQHLCHAGGEGEVARGALALHRVSLGFL